MDFNEYKESKKPLYTEFAKLVRRLLKPKIDKTEYNLHAIQARAKAADSLRDKLVKTNLLSSKKIENKIKDLAGCRVIFYLDSDVQKFISSRIINDIFKVSVDSYKVHHPKDKIQSSNDFYMADHFIVELSNELSLRSEYAKFKGYRCEIQVCTILNHAYAAMNHKIYKRPEVAGFASAEFGKIENRLISLAENHIIQAGYEFQKIYDDLQRLSVGKSIYDRPLLKEVRSSINNHDRYNLLNQFRKYTLPYYDDIGREFPEIINIVRSSLRAAKRAENILINTSFGSYPGKTNLDVVSECLAILNYIRYVDPEKVFVELLAIYADKNYQEKKFVLLKIKNLSEYNFKILEKAGYFVQECLCARIVLWDDQAILNFKAVIIEVCREIFKTDCDLTTFAYDSVTFAKGNLHGSTRLLDIRNQAIGFLKKLYLLLQSDNDKHEIFTVLTSAMQYPSLRNYDDELSLIILKNCFDIVSFNLEESSNTSYALLALIEASFFSTYKTANSITKKLGFSSEVLEQAKLLKNKILEFRNKINSSTQFVIYKTLIGYRSVFIPEWSKRGFSYDEKNTYRTNKINKFIKTIKLSNATYWSDIILQCVKVQSNDMSVVAHFVKFLELLGKNKPKFSYKLIHEKHSELANYLGYVLVGLLESNLKNDTNKLIVNWISVGKYLEQFVWTYRRLNTLDEDVLILILNKAIESKDFFTLKHLISAVMENFDLKNKQLIKKVIIPSIVEFTKNQDASWVEVGLINSNKVNALFGALDASDIDIILEGLVRANSIDYSVELLLLPIAMHNPEKVVHFFGERLIYIPTDRSRYDRLPYDFNMLREPLSNHANLIVNASIIWYQKNELDFKHKGAKFIKLIFSNFNESLENKLQMLLQDNFKLYLPIVISILGNYSGEIFLYDTCKKIVEILPKNSKSLKEIQSIMLGESNVISTSGEFGLTEFYKDKKIQIQTWLDDSNLKIKKFAEDLLKRVDNNIGFERRRAEQDIARRKRE